MKDYVIQTSDSSVATTKIAVGELTDEGFTTTWLMTREPYTDRNRRTRMIEASLFPGYLFVSLSLADERWKMIPQFRAVKRLLGSGPNSPTSLPEGAVSRLRSQFEAGDFKPKVVPLIAVSDRLHIDAGPFAGHIGVCTMARGERIKVLMSILGDEREIEMWGGLARRAAE